MTRTHRNTAIVASVILAIPTVNFMSALVVFPLAIYALFAIIANFGPLAMLVAAGLERVGLRIDWAKLFDKWAYCAIVWVGCAFGLSRWGDAAASLGGRNEPYFKVLFMPYIALYQYLVG
jgi:hypothetical protein